MDTEIPVDFSLGAEREGAPGWSRRPASWTSPRRRRARGDGRAAVGVRRLVIDLSRLAFLDTSGMRLVVEALQDTQIRGVRLALVRGSEDVQRLFRVARLEDRLPFFDDLRAALDAR